MPATQTPRTRAEAAARSFELPDNWQEGREVRSGLAIDHAYSLDRDDAISATTNEAGDATLHVSIAEIGSFVPAQSSIARYAYLAARSRYRGRDVVAPMLPKRLSEDVLSLLPGTERPVLTASMPIGKKYSHDDITFSFERLKVEAMTPETLTQRIAAMDEGVLALAGTTKSLYSARTGKTNGEYSVANEDGVMLPGKQRAITGPLVVAESAIYYNHLTARFMAEHKIPAIFRVYDQRLAFVGAQPRAHYDVHPTYHKLINVGEYMHGTSPIRRLPDLVNQTNLIAFLRGQRAPYNQERVEQITRRVNLIAERDASLPRPKPYRRTKR